MHFENNSRRWCTICREMIINILVSYVLTKNIFIALLVKNMSEKIVNVWKLIPNSENDTGKLFFGSIVLRPH